MSTALDMDLATLVGELPDVPCEHRSHSWQHEPGPATHYVSYACPDCPRVVECQPVCASYINRVRENHYGQCVCGNTRPMAETTTILGPVNGRAS